MPPLGVGAACRAKERAPSGERWLEHRRAPTVPTAGRPTVGDAAGVVAREAAGDGAGT